MELTFEFRGKRYMDAQKGLEAFGKSLKKGMAAAMPVLKKEMTTYLESTALAMKQRHSTPWPGGTGAKTLSRRSGAGMRSLIDGIKVEGTTYENLKGRITGLPYLRTHEFGATIRPKKGKYLTVPLPAALKSDGTPIKSSARDWQNTFVIKSKKGNLLIVRREGKDIVPLYVLKESVTIQPRLGLQETLNSGMPYFVDRALDAMTKAILNAPVPSVGS